MNLPDKPLVLFDGVCNLCNSSVQFIIRNDPQGKFLFASLQSPIGQEVSKHFGLKTDDFDSFVLVENGQAYTHSTGILKLFKRLGGFWKIFYIFILVPLPIRNIFYTFVARNRYRWFGKKQECWLPTPNLKSRFIS